MSRQHALSFVPFQPTLLGENGKSKFHVPVSNVELVESTFCSLRTRVAVLSTSSSTVIGIFCVIPNVILSLATRLSVESIKTDEGRRPGDVTSKLAPV